MKRTVLLYGRTNAGKTAQIGVMAEYLKKTTGKNSRLYTADKGGLDVIMPHVELGIIELVPILTTDPWIFLNKAVRGMVRDPQGTGWIKGNNDNIAMFAFESMRGIAEELMVSMAQKAAQGVNIGGGANISFAISDGQENLKVSGSNMAHFGVAQARITEEVWESFKLPSDYVLWTSSVSKDEDTTASGKVLGPDVIGKALTAEVPRWFNYTFRIDVLPAQGGKPERHILYLGNHVDVGAGNAAGLGNIRRPLDAPELKTITIEPANISEALKMAESGHNAAKEALKKRLAL